MKRAVLTAIVIGASAFSVGSMWAAAPANSEWNMALSLDIPGKGGWTTCYTFAKTLQGRFLRAGGECHLVIYDWTDAYHYSDRHAFVVYRDPAGRYWGMDNRSAKPRWMAGKNPTEWAAFWDQDKTINRVEEETATGVTLADAGARANPNAAAISAQYAGFSRNTDWLAGAP